MQSTFLNAHRALKRGVKPKSELAWLFKIAHNVCLTRKRSFFRRRRIESPSDFDAVQESVAAPPRDASEELLGLNDALSDMPESQRRAILLREWQGLSYHEIARELNVSQSAVETLIFRARRTLAANLTTEREQPEPRLLARARRAVDAGTLLMALKTLFEGGAAVKAAAAAVAVTGTAVAISSPQQVERPPAQPTAPAAIEIERAVSTVSASPSEPALRPRTALVAERVETRSATAQRTAPARPPAAVRQAAVELQPAATASVPVDASSPAAVHELAAPAPPPTPAQGKKERQRRELQLPPGQEKKSDPVGEEEPPVAEAEPAADPEHGKGEGDPKAEQPDK